MTPFELADDLDLDPVELGRARANAEFARAIDELAAAVAEAPEFTESAEVGRRRHLVPTRAILTATLAGFEERRA